MKNYEKYAAGKEKVAELIQWIADNDIDDLVMKFCNGKSCKKEGEEDADCTKENMKTCILAWLDKEVHE